MNPFPFCFPEGIKVTHKGERVLLFDEKTGESFELGPEEFFLCQLLDGTHTLSEIQKAFEARFETSLSEEGLLAFCDDMRAHGLLVPCRSQAISRKRPFRWKLFDPAGLLRILARLLAPFRKAVWLLPLGIGMAFFSFYAHQDQFFSEIQRMARFEEAFGVLFKFLFSLLIINLLSKIMQGIVCTYFGEAIHAFGLRLAYGFWPRFYIEKQPIRMLDRHGQLWSYAAPLLTKLALFVIGTLIWRWFTQTNHQLGQYGLILSQFALGSFLFTANPLWRADGYAWLSTYLGFPKLRERAFTLSRLMLRRHRLSRNIPPRERYGLLLYAAASLAFTVVFLGMVFLVIASSLEVRYGGAGVTLSLFLLALFSLWLFSLLKRKRRRKSLGFHFLGSGMRWALGISVLAMVAMIPYPYEISGEAVLLPLEKAEVRAKTQGQIIDISVKEGDAVEKGQLLARLDDWEELRNISLAKKDLEKKKAELALLLAGAKPEAIDYAKQQLAMAKVKAYHSQKRLKLLNAPKAQGTVSALEYEDALAQAQLDQAAIQVEAANLALVKSPPLAEEVAIKQAEIEQLKIDLQFLTEELERTRLYAPLSGRIITPYVEQKQGTYLHEGDLFAEIENTGTLRAEILVPESDIGEVGLGASVEVRVWAYPDRSFTGRVVTIAPTAEEAENPFVKVVRVTTELDNHKGTLRTGMTGYAKVEGGTKPLGVAFTRALVRFFLVEVWSWIP